MLHLGNLLPTLSADVIARYYRLKGNEVLFVSGSDVHGTPVEVEAVKQGISPRELTEGNHAKTSVLFKKWAISFDNYSTTEGTIHKGFVADFHRNIESNGYIFTKETELPYCPKCKRYLPDRFVEGICPRCGYQAARGDQCERCGRLLDPEMLQKSYCTICGTNPVFQKVNHWYFNLPKFSNKLKEYISKNKQFTSNTKNFSLNFIREGLKSRAITRDSEWGIPAPFKGAEGKTLYVWFENVLGYISATVEYFSKKGNNSKWKNFWFEPDTKILCFIGKDNIPFHTIIFPALLLASNEGYNLPWNVCTNEWLNFEGQKSSKSRRIGIWIDEALEMFTPDYWRYTLIANRPETRDTNFSWKVFLEKVNSDLNDNFGNFIHRTLTFLGNFYDGYVPKPSFFSSIDKEMLNQISISFKQIDAALSDFKIQVAARELMNLAREGNRYLNYKKPWTAIEKYPEDAANTLYVATQIVKALSILSEPFIPFSSFDLRRMLNSHSDAKWDDALNTLNPGHKIEKAEPLFYKIQNSEEELENMLDEKRSKMNKVSIEEFSQIDLRVGKIVNAKKVPKSNNLIKLEIDIGYGQIKTAVAGIAHHYKPDEIVGQQLVVLVNLEPRKIWGIQSEVMILAAQDKNKVVIIKPEKQISVGSQIS